jgi:hypothetical protein
MHPVLTLAILLAAAVLVALVVREIEKRSEK